MRGLIGDDAHRSPIHPGESNHDVLGEVLVDFKEIAIIDDQVDHILDVIGEIGFERNQRI